MLKKFGDQNIVLVIVIVICMIVILHSIPTSYKQSNYLSNNYAFTIGKTLKYEFADGFKDCIEYKYYVRNFKYIGCITIDPEISSSLNKFYKVKYSKIKPDISEIYFSKEITDSVEIIKAGFKYKK
jgi:hypothetical protein